MLRALILFLLTVAAAFCGNNCTLSLGSHTSFSTTVAGDWANCGGVKPQNGDNISVSGSGSFKLDTAMTFGSGQAPLRPYPATITGGAGGSTTCGSAPSLAGTSLRSGSLSCGIVAGVCTPYIVDRGLYTATGTTAIASTCSGGTPTWALTWNAGGGTPAILAGSNLTVVIAAAIVARGDVLAVDSYGDTSTGVQFTSGGKLTFDFSLSAAGTPIYNLGVQGNNAAYPRDFSTDLTCTPSTCSVATTGGGAWRSDYGSNPSGSFDLRGMTLNNFGDANTLALFWPGLGVFRLWNNVLTSTSCFELGYFDNASSIDIQHNTFKSSVQCNYLTPHGVPSALFDFSSSGNAFTSGVRNISYNVMDNGLISSANMNGFTIAGNVVQSRGFSSGTASNLWAAFSNNAMLSKSVAGADSGFQTYFPSGSMDHNLFYNLDNRYNWHVMNGTIAATQAETFNVFSMDGPNNGDSGEIAGFPNGGTTLTFSNNFILADGANASWSEPGGSPSGIAGHMIYDHNYWFADYGANNANTFGFVDLDESTVEPSGFITEMKCNTLWNPSDANSFFRTRDEGATPTVSNPGAPANVDYNWGRGSWATQASCSGCTNQTNGYAAAWSGGTPGAHDQLAIDPGVDYKRGVEVFATSYLNISPSRGVWNGTTDYALGDTVSSTTTYYFGQTIVFTCVSATGCSHTAAPQPGSTATGWFDYWEPYTTTWLKSSVSSGATFIDGALVVLGVGEDTACTLAAPCDAVTALRHWIMAGIVHSNPAFWGSCSDGTTIGPIDVPRSRRLPLAVSVQ